MDDWSFQLSCTLHKEKKKHKANQECSQLDFGCEHSWKIFVVFFFAALDSWQDVQNVDVETVWRSNGSGVGKTMIFFEAGFNDSWLIMLAESQTFWVVEYNLN